MKILVIDDSPDDRELIARTLKQADEWHDVVVVEAENGSDGLRALHAGGFDGILLDYSLPGEDGLTVLGDIQLRYPEMPVVMITGEGSEGVAANAFKSGASDYVMKSDITVESLTKAMASAQGAKRREAELIQQAHFDELTGLPNRRVFNERLLYLLQRMQRDGGPFGIVFMDLDGFKAVNDTHGHEIGDLLLKEGASRLESCLRNSDLLARIGGDEFVAILENLPNGKSDVGMRIIDRLAKAIDDTPFVLDGISISIGLSSGLALCPQMANDRAELLRLADLAMYEAKSARKQALAKPKTAAAR